MPFLYPIFHLLYAIVTFIQKLRDPGFSEDLTYQQIDALHGFLESGPQSVLQTYIFLLGESETHTVLLISTILISWISLTVTAIKFNRPDPNQDRDHAKDSKGGWGFIITSTLFHIFCVSFRIIFFAFLFASVRWWGILILFLYLMVICQVYRRSAPDDRRNVMIALFISSALVPNGYLLHKFLGNQVDLGYQGVKKIFLQLNLIITGSFMIITTTIMTLYLFSKKAQNFIITNCLYMDHGLIFYTITGSILLTGFLTVLTCILHLLASIKPLYKEPVEVEVHDETLLKKPSA